MARPVPNSGGIAAGLTGEAYRFLRDVKNNADAVAADVATLQALTYGETFAIGGSLSNQDYNVLINAPFGFSIASITSKCRSGSCTATFKIGGVSLGGGANSVSSSEQTKTHSSANAVAVSDDFTCTISANSSCIDAVFTIAYTRT